MPLSPEGRVNRGERVKDEKPSVNWVTCHRRTPALSLIPPQGTDSGSRWGLVNSMCVHCQLKVCLCVVVLSFSFTSWSTSHLSGGHSAHLPQPGAPTATWSHMGLIDKIVECVCAWQQLENPLQLQIKFYRFVEFTWFHWKWWGSVHLSHIGLRK